jgi:hypothetical protein
MTPEQVAAHIRALEERVTVLEKRLAARRRANAELRRRLGYRPHPPRDDDGRY